MKSRGLFQYYSPPNNLEEIGCKSGTATSLPAVASTDQNAMKLEYIYIYICLDPTAKCHTLTLIRYASIMSHVTFYTTVVSL